MDSQKPLQLFLLICLLTGKQSGSVGRLLPDVECQTIDPESGDITPLAEGGILCFRGPNIFDWILAGC